MNLFKESLIFCYRAVNKLSFLAYEICCHLITQSRLFANRVEYGKGFKSNGMPVIHVKKSGKFRIGDHVTMNNGKFYNQIGRQQACFFIVGEKARLELGNEVGISATAIVCMNRIEIGDKVKIGGGTVIYDTDFHSVDASSRSKNTEDRALINTKPVKIEKNAFIGAHSIILKGVTIGENAVVGAGSVVAKDVPANEIWGGNPVRFINNIGNEENFRI